MRTLVDDEDYVWVLKLTYVENWKSLSAEDVVVNT